MLDSTRKPPDRRRLVIPAWSTFVKPSNVLIPKDRVNTATPMRCPVCNGPLERVLIRDLGGVTDDLVLQLHAGHCPEH